MSTTPGKTFLETLMDYIGANDVEGMIDDQYTEDAVLISPFDILDTPPPHIVRGNAALKEFFKKYLAWQGSIDVESFYNVVERDDSICFHAIFTSHTGRWVVGDDWYMKDGKIHRHYSFAHKLS